MKKSELIELHYGLAQQAHRLQVNLENALDFGDYEEIEHYAHLLRENKKLVAKVTAQLLKK